MSRLGENIKKVFNESWLIVTNSRQHWLKVKSSRYESVNAFSGFLVPGLILVFAAVVLGDILFESEYGIILRDILLKGLRKVVLLLMTFFASTMILYEISRIFRIPVEFDMARKIVIYSMLPLVITTVIIGLFPFLYILAILGLYSFYLLIAGLTAIFDLDPAKQMPYLFVVISSMFMVYVVLALLLSRLTALIIY